MKLLILILFYGILDVPTYCKSAFDPFCFVLNSDNIEWPSKTVKKIFSSSGRYKASNIIPTRFQTKGLFAVVAYPRLKTGVPITLGKVPLLANRRLPEVKPFPTWNKQEEGNADAIQNAVDLYLDERGVLWVLDTGWVHTTTQPHKSGHPRAWGINFNTGKVLYDVDLSKHATPSSSFQYIVAENVMGRPFIYISCGDVCSVIVWDVVKEKGGLIPLPTPENKSSEDKLYMVLLKPANQEPVIVFSHLSYPVLFGAKTSSMRFGHLGEIENMGIKTGEMVLLGTDSGSKIFFRWKGDSRVRVWDLATREGERGAVVGTEDEHRVSTHVVYGSRYFTWSLDSNFPDFIHGTAGSIGPSAMIRPLVKDEEN